MLKKILQLLLVILTIAVLLFGISRIVEELNSPEYILDNAETANKNAQDEPSQEPVIVAEPDIATEPVIVAEPDIATEPVIVAEPVIAAEPVIVAEPVIAAEPVIVAEPDIVANSISKSANTPSINQPLSISKDGLGQIISSKMLEQSIFLYLIFLLLILIALFAVTFLLLRQQRWRSRYELDTSIVFPDKHLDTMENLTKEFRNLLTAVIQSNNNSASMQKENIALTTQSIDSISKFNSLIDVQQDEIERLKEGYDFSIKKQSLQALIGINELVEDLFNGQISDETKDRLTKVQNYISSDLDDADIEKISFKNGEIIRDLPASEFEIVSTEITEDDKLHGKVYETNSQGYAFAHANGRTIIKKAKINAYKKEV